MRIGTNGEFGDEVQVDRSRDKKTQFVRGGLEFEKVQVGCLGQLR